MDRNLAEILWRKKIVDIFKKKENSFPAHFLRHLDFSGFNISKGFYWNFVPLNIFVANVVMINKEMVIMVATYTYTPTNMHKHLFTLFFVPKYLIFLHRYNIFIFIFQDVSLLGLLWLRLPFRFFRRCWI